MSTYAEMDRLRKLSRPLYRKLRALGLDLQAEEDAGMRSGYRIDLVGTRSLLPGHVDRLRRRVEEATPVLLRILWAHWDEDLEAIRGEGGTL